MRKGSPPTITIELHAVWRGGRWEVVDEDGACLLVITKKTIIAATRQVQEPAALIVESERQKPWKQWAKRERQRLVGESDRSNMSAWGRKFQSMAASCRTRSPVRRHPGNERSCDVGWTMRLQGISVAIKARRKKRERTEWDVWSTTVARNIKHRAARKRSTAGGQDHGQQAEAAT